MERLRAVFNTICIGGAAIVWLFVSSLVAFPFLWLKSKNKDRAVRKFVYIQSRGIVFFMRLASSTFRVETAERAPGNYVVVANHASALDLYTISAFGFDNVVYITKGWVFKLPFFRYVMNGAGYVDAEKTSPAEMLEICKQAVQKGCDIVLFPQGSRKDPHARFKSGAFYLAEQLNLPVVPVAIAGTHKMLAAGNFWIKPAPIVLKSFPAKEVKDYPGELGHLHMAQDVKKQIMDFVDRENMAFEAPRTQYPEITTLIPHRPPMLLVDKILAVEEKTGKARAVIGKDHLFLREDGTLAPEAFCELVAQGFGVCEACRRLNKGLTLEGGGYLANLREAEFMAPARAGDELVICTEKIDECFDTYIVRGEIFCKDAKLAQVTVYIFMWQGKEPPKTV